MTDKSISNPIGSMVPHVVPSRRRIGNAACLLLVAALAAAGCGDGSSDTPGSGGTVSPRPSPTPSPTPGEPSELGPTVQTARIAFNSDTGERCCVALPASQTPSGALLVLDDLPAGPATVIVSFFAEDFAPSVPGTEATCKTVPADLGRPCETTRVASPSFESDMQSVEIIAGGQTAAPDLTIHALPFVFDFIPENGETVEDPVAFAFTVADPVTAVEEESVVLEVTLQEPVGSSFRPLTKRVALQLSPCDDGTEEPCSLEGDREVVGFHAQSDATMLLPGPVDVRIRAVNQDEPPQAADFMYQFDVVESGNGEVDAAAPEGPLEVEDSE